MIDSNGLITSHKRYLKDLAEKHNKKLHLEIDMAEEPGQF
jgi:hypothetical protein